MIQLTASGDKYFASKVNPNGISTSHIQPNSHDDDNHQHSFHRLLSKLNIPINCFYNQHIRQHYLEEYTAKYSKAKHLLSNARRKQRKIIITYYEEKEKEDNIDQLQIVKDSLLEENEKIKRFKEALKEKLIIYQQRIQFLKNTQFWSALETQQLQKEPIEADIENLNPQRSIDHFSSFPDSPTKTDSCHLLHDQKYSDNHLDDSCPTISDEYHFEIDTPSIYRESSHTECVSEVGENISNEKSKGYFSWLQNSSRYDRYTIFREEKNNYRKRGNISNNYVIETLPEDIPDVFISINSIKTIPIIILAIILVIFVNDLLEQFFIYLTKPSRAISTLSPSDSMIKSLFRYLLSTIYNYTRSWR